MQNILLLHGALGCANDLLPLASQLQKHGLNTHLFSLSGHGKTSFAKQFNIAAFSEELALYIQQNNLQNTAVFGYSMGGYIALHLASDGFPSIDRVVTLGTKFNWSQQSVEKETAMLNPDRLLQKVPAFAKSLEDKHGHQWKELLHHTAELMWDIHRKHYLNDEALKRLATKTFIGLADHDQMVSLEETQQVYRTIPAANMYMVPGAKHPIESVNVELLAHIVVTCMAY